MSREKKNKWTNYHNCIWNIHKSIEVAIIDHSSNSQSLFVWSHMTEQPQTLQGQKRLRKSISKNRNNDDYCY